MRALLCAVSLVAAMASMGRVAAETYPSRPITLVVPLAPGGSTDVIGRVMAEGMGQVLGQSVIVENTSGAGGTIGVGRVARATPDGYTIQVGQWGTNVATGAIYPLKFDLLGDLDPIALVATQPLLIVARKSMPANTLKELLAWLKANPDKATQGNSGIGSPTHVAAILLQQAVGARWQMVQYRSAGQTMQDLLTGSIDIALDTPALSLEQLSAGTIKAYAVTADKRLALAPDIPTTDEAGLPGFRFSFWHGLWAPKGTPPEILDKLNAAAVKALAEPRIKERMLALAQVFFPPEQMSRQALATFQGAEIEKWWPIIKAAGIKPQQ